MHLTAHGVLEAYLTFLQVAAFIVGGLILVSSIDDMTVDVWYWVRTLYRALVIQRRYAPLPQAALFERTEQPIAIMVPAWREQDVIASMIENTINALDYRDYVIFVGAYPNDPETNAEIERAKRRHRRVVRVETPIPGPTSKADCLNHIVRAIFAYEAEHGIEFAGVVLHDSEDVVHPLELKFFNYLLPRKDMIQLPVVSLERGLGEPIACTYMDEFAEWHAKDLVVRESAVGWIPSAGVGTCFSRKAMDLLRQDGRDPFSIKTLTEDYDIGVRLAEHGLRSIIARYPVDFRVRRKTFFGLGREKETTLRMPLCVREFFPNTFRTSYRQKARWTIGIVLQGWGQVGWTKSLAANYFLLRDRKALLTPFLAVGAYFLLLNYLFLEFLIDPARLMPPQPWFDLLSLILIFNTAALVVRIVQRFYFVTRLYGWEQGLASAPRMVVGSLVHFAATLRALRLFVGHLFTRRPLAWDKTMHEFPSGVTLLRERRRLGEILTTWEAISEPQLTAALREQRETRRPLGRILLTHGWLDDETLAEAIATQSDLPRGHVTPEELETHRELLPEAVCIRLRAIPVGRNARGEPILAVAGPLSDAQKGQVAAVAGQPPVEQIVREGEIVAALRALRTGRELDGGRPGPPLLGEMLIERGHVTQAAFDSALDQYQPDRDGRIGEYLMRLGVITPLALADTVAEQERLAAA